MRIILPHSVIKKLGKPVITSNQSLIWDTLESIGMNKDIQGFGKLFNLDQ